MRLPVNQPVKILLRSKDVLHNFAVPEFRVKMDMVPGMVTFMWLTPTRTGQFDMLCEELCGIAHFAMRGKVTVTEQAEFDSWLSQQVTFAESQAMLRGNPASGQALYTSCGACHGQQGEGNAALNAPRLAGINAWYFKQTIDKFKNGLRGIHEDDIYGRQMAPLAAILANDAMIYNVAAYLESLANEPAETTITGNIENGRRLYTTCGTCHGDQGEGIWSVAAPRLTGLNDWYLVRQLQHFKDGIRGSHPLDLPGRQMRLLSITLTDDQAINDVVAYINSLSVEE